jgi:Fic family protein
LKLPLSAPTFSQLLEAIPKERMPIILQNIRLTDAKGRYLHWDQIRHKTPPDDLSLEEWWLGMSIARRGSSSQSVPFDDGKKTKFFFAEPPELKALLQFVDMNAGGVLGASHGLTAEDGRRYMRRSLAEEPFSSSFIEGAVTTRDRAKKMIFENRAPQTRDEKMVLNNYMGMEFVKEIVGENLTIGHILELHKIMTEGTLDDASGSGRLRTDADRVEVVYEPTNTILHTPPPAQFLPERLQALCDFANAAGDDLSYCHPLLKAMTLHFMLAFDHPFVDGNGRTARALFYWFMLKAGYWLMEYTSISSVIADAPVSYYKAFLFSETADGDLTYFFLHQARATRDALKRMHEYADNKKQEFEDFRAVILEQKADTPLNSRQIALIQDFHLGREKIMMIRNHQERYNVSYLTARKDLEDLVGRGLLFKSKQGRDSIYKPGIRLKKEVMALLR